MSNPLFNVLGGGMPQGNGPMTDAAIVGRHVGTTLMVARYAVNTLKEVETSLSRFEQNGIPVKGVILNSIFRRASAYQDYGYYEYEYKSDAK